MVRVSEYSVCSHDGSIIGFTRASGNFAEMRFVDAIPWGRYTLLLQQASHDQGVNQLDVDEQNHQGVAFNKKKGFIETGRFEPDGQGRRCASLQRQRA
ncbi:GCN5-like N-acetyltransferase [Pantoea ananatis LMG 5342]|nr:GCN5-like N-acetyltransferase [Pantoea ananatis LMG 5342]